MVRLIALILSFGVGLFASTVAHSKGPKDAVIIDSLLFNKIFSSGETVLYARNYDHAQTKFNSSKAHLSQRGRRAKNNDQPYSKLSSVANRSNSSRTDNNAGQFVPSESVFDIRVPGDPRVHVETEKDVRFKSGKSDSLFDFKKNGAIAVPGDFLKRLGSIPNMPDSAYEENPTERLEIQVSHSTHIFKLLAHAKSTEPEVLYQCRIGLGAPEFPTPVGVYYVTHIYDQNPWWIPPANRAWAAGDSPSKRVYGGTMAPLLKKRTVTSKKKDLISEDRVEGLVKLEDYGYRFHGTNAPRSIGRNQSHGCVRMLSDDAKKVAAIIENKVGVAQRKESENGTFAILSAPVRLNLIK